MPLAKTLPLADVGSCSLCSTLAFRDVNVEAMRLTGEVIVREESKRDENGLKNVFEVGDGEGGVEIEFVLGMLNTVASDWRYLVDSEVDFDEEEGCERSGWLLRTAEGCMDGREEGSGFGGESEKGLICLC